MASPPWITPTFAVPQPDGFSILPSQPSRCSSAIASAAMVIALTPRSGARAGVAGRAGDADGHAIAAGGPDRDLVGGAAIEIEGQLWPAEHADRGIASTVQTDLLLHGPEERQRPMLRLFGQDVQCGRQDRGRAGAVVGAQRRVLVGRNDVFPFLHRPGAAANRHRIDVGHQQSSRPGPGARQFEDEIADLAAVRDLAMGLIEAQHLVGRPRLAELIDEERHDGPLLATETGNGERLKQ